MPLRWPLLIALLALVAAAPLRADPNAAHAMIVTCLQEIGPRVRGIAHLTEYCPGIDQAARALAPDSFLPADWRTRLTAGGLADVLALSDRYSGSPPSVRPEDGRLRAIAAELQPPSLPTSWWGHVGELIRTWFGPASRAVIAWLKSLPGLKTGQSLGGWLVIVLIALVLAAAAIVIAIELRAAGVFDKEPRGRRQARPGVSRSATAADETPTDLTALDSVAAHERPALLLKILIDALSRTHRLEHDRGMTCRELVTHARLDTLLQRERFVRIALAAEQATYGPRSVVAMIAPEVLSDARALYVELAAS